MVLRKSNTVETLLPPRRAPTLSPIQPPCSQRVPLLERVSCGWLSSLAPLPHRLPQHCDLSNCDLTLRDWYKSGPHDIRAPLHHLLLPGLQRFQEPSEAEGRHDSNSLSLPEKFYPSATESERESTRCNNSDSTPPCRCAESAAGYF